MLTFHFLSAQSGWVEKYMMDEAYKNKIISLAKQAMIEKPITVTNESSPRSAGGKHDFFRREIIGGKIRPVLIVLIFKGME